MPEQGERYGLGSMMLWATVPYALWQLSYHVLITVRRRDKIAAGRPTSFTWLRKSFAKRWIGKLVLALPEHLQEPAFMLIQYLFAVTTMLPCPIWFRYRWLSAVFLLVLFAVSIHNGAAYYIDVFGKRFQNELEQLKKEVNRWQNSPDLPTSPELAARIMAGKASTNATPVPGETDAGLGVDGILDGHQRSSSVDQIPLLDSKDARASAMDEGTTENSNHKNGNMTKRR